MEELKKNVVNISLECIIKTCNDCLSDIKSNSLQKNKLETITMNYLKEINDIITCHELITIDESICVIKSLVDNLIKDIQIMNTVVNDELFNDYVYYKDNVYFIRLATSNLQKCKYT